MWVDNTGMLAVGDLGYLIETHNTTNNTSWTGIVGNIGRTNQSHAPRIDGWLGETDNRSRHARGVGRVVRTNKQGDRVYVKRLDGAALAAALRQLGYPELVPAKSAEPFDHTHWIAAPEGLIPVTAGAEDPAQQSCPLYTHEEWECAEAADWEWDQELGVTFQGKPRGALYTAEGKPVRTI